MIIRIHFSRMRTARFSCRLGGVYVGVSAPGSVCPDGCLPRGTSALGVYTPCPLHAGIHPPMNRITDRCKNITFPQLRLRAVKIESIVGTTQEIVSVFHM